MGIIGEIIRLDKKSFFLISIILTILYGSKQWKLHVFKRLRSFYAENFGSVDQWAAKLPAIKLKEWFDPGRSRTQADRFECGQGWKEDFFFRPPTLTASNFAALWPTDSKFSAIKDLNLLKSKSKVKWLAAFWRWFLPSQNDLIYIGLMLQAGVSFLPRLYSGHRRLRIRWKNILQQPY